MAVVRVIIFVALIVWIVYNIICIIKALKEKKKASLIDNNMDQVNNDNKTE